MSDQRKRRKYRDDGSPHRHHQHPRCK